MGWALTLVVVGTLWLLAASGVPVRWEVVLPATLTLVGGVLLLGGARAATGGLVGLGVVLAVLGLLAVASPVPPPLTAGERTHVVAEIDELAADYTLGAGTLTVDVRDLELPEGTTTLRASVAMGELIVLVPAEVALAGEGRVAFGELVGPDDAESGVGPRLSFESGDAARRLELDLQVTMGRMEVRR